jgi:Tfp pilus assembly protein PilF
MDEGLERVVEGKADSRAAELLEDSHALNPDVRVDVALARIAREGGRDWRPYLERALDGEPESAGVHALRAQYLSADGEDAEARRAYERASELDPLRYPPRPGGD